MGRMPTLPLPVPATTNLVIFDTHPIQYRSPIFKKVFSLNPGTKVYFFNERADTDNPLFKERGQIPKQNWGISLLDGFDSETLNLSGMSFAAVHSAFKKILDTERPASIVLMGYAQWENWILLFMAKARGIHVIHIGDTFNDGDGKKRPLVKEILMRWFFSKVSTFVSVGEKNRSFYLRKGVEADRIVATKHCVDSDFFGDRVSSIREQWRKQHGIPDSAIVILFMGRLVDRKRPMDAVKLSQLLRSPGVCTVIAGNGYLEETLKPFASERLRLIGFQNQLQARECYHGSDLLFVPSEWETWGLVVNEAFATGIPAVVTDTCGCADDLVVRGETGEVFGVGDLEPLARKLDALFSNPDQLRLMGRRARDKVLKEYSVEKFALALLSATDHKH